MSSTESQNIQQPKLETVENPEEIILADFLQKEFGLDEKNAKAYAKLIVGDEDLKKLADELLTVTETLRAISLENFPPDIRPKIRALVDRIISGRGGSTDARALIAMLLMYGSMNNLKEELNKLRKELEELKKGNGNNNISNQLIEKLLNEIEDLKKKYEELHKDPFIVLKNGLEKAKEILKLFGIDVENKVSNTKSDGHFSIEHYIELSEKLEKLGFIPKHKSITEDEAITFLISRGYIVKKRDDYFKELEEAERRGYEKARKELIDTKQLEKETEEKHVEAFKETVEHAIDKFSPVMTELARAFREAIGNRLPQCPYMPVCKPYREWLRRYRELQMEIQTIRTRPTTQPQPGIRIPVGPPKKPEEKKETQEK